MPTLKRNDRVSLQEQDADHKATKIIGVRPGFAGDNFNVELRQRSLDLMENIVRCAADDQELPSVFLRADGQIILLNVARDIAPTKTDKQMRTEIDLPVDLRSLHEVEPQPLWRQTVCDRNALY